MEKVVPPESGLKHKPFSALRNAVATTAAPAQKPLVEHLGLRTACGVLRPKPLPSRTDKPPLGRVIVREEFDATEAALITRVIGVPAEQLSVFGKQWREILAKTVAIEGRDLLVLAAECERIAALLRDAGASEVVIVQRHAPSDLSQAGEAGGTLRAQIRRGLRVAIVLKADQETGALTEGVVRDILTSSPEHPRGIKVRLESGQVGRVRRILSR